MPTFSILAALSDDERRRIMRAANRRRFKKGDIIFHEGDPGNSFHLLDKGRVKVSTVAESGDMTTLTILGRGSFFGEQALLSPGAIRTSSVIALEAAETLTLSHDTFEALRDADRAVDRLLIEVLSQQVQRLTGQVREAMFVPADERIVRRLIDLTEIYHPGDDGGPSGPVVIPLTQDELGQLAGTTRPTVTRTIKSLAPNVTSVRGKITVADPAAL